MTKALRASLLYSSLIVTTVVVINLVTSPGFLWFLFPVFGVLWWPLSAYFAGKKQPFAYAVCGFVLLSGLFIATYLIASPTAHPWFIYPILGVVWWPLSVFFAKNKRPLTFALIAFVIITAMFIILFLLTSPGTHPWFIYPILGAAWWPLSVWGAKKGARAFSVAGGLLVIGTLLTINLLTSPGFWWWVYPAFFSLWWPVSVLLGKKAASLGFAAGSAVAASLFLVAMYFIQTPNAEPWYLYALLPLFWWPVSKLLAPRIGPVRQALIAAVVFAAYYTALVALLHGVSSLLSVFILIAAAWLVYAASISKYRMCVFFAGVNAVLLAIYFYLVWRFVTPDVQPWFWYTLFPLAGWPVAAALKEKALKPAPVALSAGVFLLYYGALNLFLSPETPWVLFLTLSRSQRRAR